MFLQPRNAPHSLRLARLLLFAALLVSLDARGADREPEPPPVRVARELLALPEERLNIGEAALRLGALVDGDTDVSEGRRLIGVLATRVQGLVQGRTDLAHAKEASRLGAPAPLAKDYWQRVSSLGANDLGGKRLAPRPFDVASLLRPGGQPLRSGARQPLCDFPTLLPRASSAP